MGEWKEYKFSDFVDINPTVSMKSGLAYSFIEMKDLQDGIKYCFPSAKRKLSGGARFKEGDTLFARITPCLENGKICMVKGLENGVGFGSTEFLVFRGKENISDNDFVFYLSRWDEVRGFAESNFEGTSGRQRVPKNCFDNLRLDLPFITEQRAIASVLSSLDDKIDLLHRQNKTLEALAKTLFRQWFVEEADESWEEDSLSKYIVVVDNRGKTPPISEEKTEYPLIEANALNGESRLVNYSVIKKFVDEKTFNTWFRDKLKKYDTIMTTVGANIGAMAMYVIDKGNIAQNIIGLSAQRISPFYLYQTLRYRIGEISQLDIGGVQPSVKVPHLLSMIIQIPPKEIEKRFIQSIKPTIDKMENNYLEISTLESLRNTLLPKLMSGEVRVKMSESEFSELKD
jgi:type I restriction enzyme S subunit